MNKKLKLLVCAVALLCAVSTHAQFKALSCAKRPFTTRVVQIDQLEGSTVFYFEYQNVDQRFMNVYEDIVVRDAHNRSHRLLNSYNMAAK